MTEIKGDFKKKKKKHKASVGNIAVVNIQKDIAHHGA
jgi:hypothetical protein